MGAEPTEPLHHSILHSSPRGRGRFELAASTAHLRSSTRGSGPSTPRGYHSPRQRTTANTPHHSTPQPGLGFHLKPSDVSELLSRSPKHQTFSRGTSDPRLLVPVKFVRATALTNNSFLNPAHQHLQTSSPTAVSEDDRWELEELNDRSLHTWKTLFPAIFQTEPPVPNESTPQHSKSETPVQQTLKPENLMVPITSSPGTRDCLSQIITQTESISLGSLDHPLGTVIPNHPLIDTTDAPSLQAVQSSPFKTGGPEAPSTSTQDIGPNQELPTTSSRQDCFNFQVMKSLESKSTENPRIEPYPDPQASTSIERLGPSPTTADDATASRALFYVDDEGDPTSMISTSCVQPAALDRLIGQESDDEDVIVFQPQPINSTASSNSPRSRDLHLFRIITDQVHSLPQQTCQESPCTQTNQPKPHSSKGLKKAQKVQKRLRRKERRESARRNTSKNDNSFSHPQVDIDSASDIDWGNQDSQLPNLSSTSKDQSFRVSRQARRRASKKKEEMEILEDYVRHTMMSEEDSEDEKVTESIPVDRRSLIQNMIDDRFLETFLRGMDPAARHQMTIDDLDQHAQEEIDNEILANGWITESSDSDDHQSEALQHNDSLESDQDLLEPGSSDGASSSEDDAGRDGLDVSTSFENKKLTGKSPQSDFVSGSDSDILEIDPEELPTFTKDILMTHKKKKGKQNKRNFLQDSDDELIEFIDELQAQWKKDRSRKAEQKRARAEARLLGPPQNAKQRKKANRRESGKPSKEPDMIDLDHMITNFVTFRPDQSSLSLPPLSKKARASVHQLATLYGLKSKSMGTGNNRYPVLHRTHRTDVQHVNKQKVRAILRRRTNAEEFFGNDRSLDGGHPSVHRVPRNREGDIVGDGVAHIGEDNIGFKLLSKMGWSMGQTIGDPNNRSALQKPLMAVMKNSKGGLGLSSFSK